MQILQNMLIDWCNSELTNAVNEGALPKYPAVERVLAIFPDYEEVAVINIFDPKAFVTIRKKNELLYAFQSNSLKVLYDDPFNFLVKSEETISLKHKTYRDKIWNEIEELIILDDKGELLYHWKRGPYFREFSKKTGISITTLYARFRKYWQSGRRKNAFLPKFSNCGKRGRMRLLKSSENESKVVKLGRKTVSQKHAEKQGKASGLRMTEVDYAHFQKGLKKYYNSTERITLKQTYKYIIADFYKSGYEIVNGVSVPIILPPESRPTFEQFRYWYDTYVNQHHTKKSRLGEREYNLTSRELLDNSTTMASCPGDLYQIDATIADIYLVSARDRTKIVGRPVVYWCGDVFARPITGFAVLMEGPSWVGAMVALDNVVTDKVQFCAEYEIPISHEDWPCKGLPRCLLADRGEFISYNADTLVNAFGMTVQNTASWRADWKGIIERHFGIANEKFIKFIPGYVPHRFPRRGDKDYKLDAVLTIDEFRKLLICYILDFNSNHYLETYPKTPAMVADQVTPYPLDLWNWGIENSGCGLLAITQEIARPNLLPRKQVTVTQRGIHFENQLYYTCDLAMRENWFSATSKRMGRKVDVAFDPRTTKRIYLILNNGNSLEVCTPTKASELLNNLDLYDAQNYFALEREAIKKEETRLLQSSAKNRAIREAIVGEAIKKTRAAQQAVHISKTARKKGIRENRAIEKQNERDKDAWLLGDNQASSKYPEHKDDSASDYVPRRSKVSDIRSARNKKWESEK